MKRFSLFFMVLMLAAVFFSGEALAGDFIKTHFSGYVKETKTEVTLLWTWKGDTTNIRFLVYLSTNDIKPSTPFDIVRVDRSHVYESGNDTFAVIWKYYNLTKLTLPTQLYFWLEAGNVTTHFTGLLLAQPKVNVEVQNGEVTWSWDIDNPPADVFYRVVGYKELEGQVLASEYLYDCKSFVWNRQEWENHTGKEWPDWSQQIPLFSGEVLAIVMRENGFQSVSVSRRIFFVPEQVSVFQNYPNPFNPATTVRYAVPRTGRVTLTIYNIRGQKVAVLYDGEQSAGEYSKTWNASNVPSGTYFAELVVSPVWDGTGNVNLPDMLIRRQIIKMQLLK